MFNSPRGHRRTLHPQCRLTQRRNTHRSCRRPLTLCHRQPIPKNGLQTPGMHYIRRNIKDHDLEQHLARTIPAPPLQTRQSFAILAIRFPMAEAGAALIQGVPLKQSLPEDAICGSTSVGIRKPSSVATKTAASLPMLSRARKIEIDMKRSTSQAWFVSTKAAKGCLVGSTI